MDKKKKKKGQRGTGVKVKRRDVPIEDDPYWNIASGYVDIHRIGRYASKFERIEDLHPEWTYPLIEGFPTFYCILGVEHDAGDEEIKAAYERKLKLSSYPDEILNEAFNVLSNPRLRKQYDELLVAFEHITKSMLPSEKEELIKKHSEHISVEKEFLRMNEIRDRYEDYIILYMHGMPDIYEIAGIKKNAKAEHIMRKCGTGTELLRKIGTILTDTASREEYDFMLSFIAKYTDKKVLKERKKNSKRWKRMDRRIFEKIVLTALSEPCAIQKYLERRDEILNNNQDWTQYLPPNNETFLSVLGLDEDSLLNNNADKREVERVIRERYRQLEKTPEVNLAYSVLKNAALREDYLWLIENHEMLDSLYDVLSGEFGFEGGEVEEEMRMPSLEEVYDILERMIAMGDIRGMKRIPPELREILDSIVLENEETGAKRRKGRSR